MDAIETQVLTASGWEYLESKRGDCLEAALRQNDARTSALRNEGARIQKQQENLINATAEGAPPPGLRAKAEALAEQQRAISREIERIDRLESLRDKKIDTHLSRNRVWSRYWSPCG